MMWLGEASIGDPKVLDYVFVLGVGVPWLLWSNFRTKFEASADFL